MWRHFVTVLIIVVVTSGTAAGLEEQFVQASGVRSRLFCSCLGDMNTIEGELYSIRVEGDIEYVRFDASGSNRTISWETESDIQGTVRCAFKAGKRGAFMFKFTRSAGCELALGDAYDRTQTQASCEGTEVVYMINESLCVTEGKVYREGETTDGFCPKVCSESGLDGEMELGMMAMLFPDEPLDCCPISVEPCLVMGGPNILDNTCRAVAFCTAFGLLNAHVDNEEKATLVFSTVAKAYTSGLIDDPAWVNVYKDSEGIWRHGSSGEAVSDSLWGPNEPSDDGGCAVATGQSFIMAVPCESLHNILCEEPVQNYPICDTPSEAFLDI